MTFYGLPVYDPDLRQPDAVTALFNNRIMQAASRASELQKAAHAAQMARFALVEATPPAVILEDDQLYDDWRQWRAENGRTNNWRDRNGG